MDFCLEPYVAAFVQAWWAATPADQASTVCYVEIPLPSRQYADSEPAAPLGRLYSTELTHKKLEWQVVVGNRASQGVCGVLSSEAGRFPFKCANRFSALDREMSFDD
eukprot:2252175-Amphidinium_carterae.1